MITKQKNNFLKFISLIFFIIICLNLTNCATYVPEPFIPYKKYDYPPPSLSGRNNGPVKLLCIDNSNIFVYCDAGWWWAGPERGWIQTGGGWYPYPRDIWPDKVHNLYTRAQLDRYVYPPTIPFPYPLNSWPVYTQTGIISN